MLSRGVVHPPQAARRVKGITFHFFNPIRTRVWRGGGLPLPSVTSQKDFAMTIYTNNYWPKTFYKMYPSSTATPSSC